jgi:segregation and condensation protein A
MTGTPATEAIALLIDLAQRGEINPWDVQVIDVIDRYLSTLALSDEGEYRRHDAELSQSGQAFLWASMLVLLKADTLMRINEEPEDPEFTDLEEESDTSPESRLPLHLERHLRRRRAAPPPKRRPVTLNELIEQLQQIAAQMEEAPVRSRALRPRPQSRSQAAQAIAHLAHDENLTELALRLEGLLSNHWSKITSGNDWLNLEQLLEWWSLSSAPLPQSDSFGDGLTSTEAALHATSRNHDRVGVFWALLLLSAQSKVELSQEEFYQDLKIRALT